MTVWLLIKVRPFWLNDVHREIAREVLAVYASEAAARAKAAVPDDDGDLVVEEHEVQQ